DGEGDVEVGADRHLHELSRLGVDLQPDVWGHGEGLASDLGRALVGEGDGVVGSIDSGHFAAAATAERRAFCLKMNDRLGVDGEPERGERPYGNSGELA